MKKIILFGILSFVFSMAAQAVETVDCVLSNGIEDIAIYENVSLDRSNDGWPLGVIDYPKNAATSSEEDIQMRAVLSRLQGKIFVQMLLEIDGVPVKAGMFSDTTQIDLFVGTGLGSGPFSLPRSGFRLKCQ